MKLIVVAVKTLISLAIILCAVAIAAAQTDKQKPTPSPVPSPMPKQLTVETPAPPAANPADVASIDAIIAALFRDQPERSAIGIVCVRCLCPERV